jgi:aspartyl-tRNA(Asn)/glutamyl-tRNA(Gln) amidotransferase subunit C
MALSESEVRHVAMLARLALSDAQVETLRTELNSILGHIDVIQKLDLEGVEPMTHAVPVVNQTRSDVVRPGLSRDEALANAPEAEMGAFRIPRIVGTSEEG